MRLTCLVASLVLLAGCQCLPAPVSDASLPAAGVLVEYREPGGQRVTRSLGAGDADSTVIADKDDTVTVVYSGSDDQGIRSAELIYDMWYSTGTSIVRPLLAQRKTTVGCPRKLVLDSENFGPDVHRWTYEFATRSENWVGGTAQSGKVTVKTQ